MQSEQIASKRLAGLLAPVFALRHNDDFGIGDTRAVREAIDFCADTGFAVLQLLPIHETIGDHSPYNPISSRALSPALLEISPGKVPGLSAEILESIAPKEWRARLRAGPVQHPSVDTLKLQCLMAAFHAFRTDPSPEFDAFKESNQSWLPKYTLFRLLVREYEGNTNWPQWNPIHQSFERAERWFHESVDFDHLHVARDAFAFVQWVAYRQWSEVRKHATSRNVLLMGELSFGVSKSSVDVWADPDLFDLDWNMGTPPIVYFDTNKDSERFGQNWGFPPYRWANHRATGFSWLRARVTGEAQFFHLCRLDHLRGYFRAYMFPWAGGAEHAAMNALTEEQIQEKTSGRWPRFVPGSGEDAESAEQNRKQGEEVISVMLEAAGEMFLFAEIMGELPDYMQRVLEDLRVPNLTFPQLERRADRTLKSRADYPPLSLVSYANHDHAPLAALYATLKSQVASGDHPNATTDLSELLKFAEWSGPEPEAMSDSLLSALQQALFETPCLLAVLMTSDLLGIEQRFNLPGSYGNQTWSERLDLSLSDYRESRTYGPRIDTVSRLIAASGRKPKFNNYPALPT